MSSSTQPLLAEVTQLSVTALRQPLQQRLLVYPQARRITFEWRQLTHQQLARMFLTRLVFSQKLVLTVVFVRSVTLAQVAERSF
jgi:hypothetical protein